MQSHTSLFNIYDARMKAGLGSEVWGVEFLLSHRFVAVYDSHDENEHCHSCRLLSFVATT